MQPRISGVVCAVLVLAASAGSRAQDQDQDQDQDNDGTPPRSLTPAAPDLTSSRTLAADPDVAAFGLLWRASIRAQLGATLALTGDAAHDGFALELSPLIELHEPPSSMQPLPSEYWRARLPLEASWGWSTARARYRVGAMLEHESDHESSHAYSKPGFLALNDVGLSARAGWRLGGLELLGSVRGRTYVVTCTRRRAQCKNFEGDASAGAQLDLVLLAPALWTTALRPFVAASGFGVLSHGSVQGESHAQVELGVALPRHPLVLQAFVLAYLGNDVGLLRGQRVGQVGGGLRITLAPGP